MTSACFVSAAERPEADQMIADRAEGALLGLAIGDAIGTTLEFCARDTYPPLTDLVGGGPFALKAGEWTDDTAMALALAESLIGRAAFDPADCMSRFLRWFREGEYSCTGRCFDIGATTREALVRFERSGDPIAGATGAWSAGNGSLMRVSPVAIWGLERGPHVIDHTARAQSATTHGAAECLAACEAFALMIAAAIRDGDRQAVLDADWRGDNAVVNGIIAGTWRTKTRDEIRSTGYVVHTLEAALWCVGTTTDFSDAVLLAANLGDDADTVAAVTGQLAGALYGASAIPARWTAKLAWYDRLKDAAHQLMT